MPPQAATGGTVDRADPARARGVAQWNVGDGGHLPVPNCCRSPEPEGCLSPSSLRAKATVDSLCLSPYSTWPAFTPMPHASATPVSMRTILTFLFLRYSRLKYIQTNYKFNCSRHKRHQALLLFICETINACSLQPFVLRLFASLVTVDCAKVMLHNTSWRCDPNLLWFSWLRLCRVDFEVVLFYARVVVPGSSQILVEVVSLLLVLLFFVFI